MRKKYRKLRYRIDECFGSETELAEAIGVPLTWLSNRLGNRTPWRIADAVLVMEALAIPPDEMHSYFVAEIDSVRRPIPCTTST